MKAGIRWIKQQMNDKRFCILAVAGVIAGIVLCAEFVLFSYSVPKILRYLILLESMFLIAWIDQRKRRIPNKILLAMLAARIVILIVEWLLVPSMGMSLLISSAFGMLLGGGMFLLAHFLSRGGVGMGDVKLFAVTVRLKFPKQSAGTWRVRSSPGSLVVLARAQPNKSFT